jgi:hypothetical protein
MSGHAQLFRLCCLSVERPSTLLRSLALRVARLFNLLRGPASKALLIGTTRDKLHDDSDRRETNAGLGFQCARALMWELDA